MGRLTTHVLDTARGKPAAGVKIMLYRVSGQQPPQDRRDGDQCRWAHRRAAAGRARRCTAGSYELVFCAGDYLRASGQAGEGVLFLDEIPIRFGVPDAGAALPCAAADLALRLFDLSGELKGTALSPAPPRQRRMGMEAGPFLRPGFAFL